MRHAVVHELPALSARAVVALLLKLGAIAILLIAVVAFPAVSQTRGVRTLELKGGDTLRRGELATVYPTRMPVLRESNPVAVMALEAARVTRDSIARQDTPRTDLTQTLADARVIGLRPVEVFDRMSTIIHFDVGSAEIRPDAIAALEGKLDLLRGLPALRIRIEGQADVRGSTASNITLAWARAGAAKVWLTDRGIAADRIEAVGFSAWRPICEGRNESCLWQNRRAEFVIVAGAGGEAPRSR